MFRSSQQPSTCAPTRPNECLEQVGAMCVRCNAQYFAQSRACHGRICPAPLPDLPTLLPLRYCYQPLLFAALPRITKKNGILVRCDPGNRLCERILLRLSHGLVILLGAGVFENKNKGRLSCAIESDSIDASDSH